jgi:hypothetical protein
MVDRAFGMFFFTLVGVAALFILYVLAGLATNIVMDIVAKGWVGHVQGWAI